MKRILVYSVLFFISLQTIAFTQPYDNKLLQEEKQCQAIQKELKLKEKLLADNLPELNIAFQNLITSLTELSSMVRTSGIDTTALDKHIVLLNAKFTKLKADRQTYQLGVKQAQAINCNLGAALVNQEIEQLRDYALNVKTSFTDLSSYFTDVILKDLQEMRYHR